MKTYLPRPATLLLVATACFVTLIAACSIAQAAEPNTVPASTKQNKPAETAADSVAVTVNGVDIKESQIDDQLRPQLAKISAQLPPAFVEQYKNQLRQQILDGIIIEQLLDKKVKEEKITITDKEVDEHLEKAAAQQNLSLNDIKEMMAARGQNFDEAKQRMKKGLAYQKLMETQWTGKINITDDEAKKYYDENAKQIEQVRASHILVKPITTDPNTDPNQAKAKAKAKAEDLLKKIKTGTDVNFAELARANSDCPSAQQGGDLNFFERGQMAPAFEEAAFALKTGQVSDVVETQFGYHIIKVTDRKNDTFEKAKEDVIKMLSQPKQAEFAEKYIDTLKAAAKIVYPPGKEPNTPAAGPAVTAKPRPDNKPATEPEKKTSTEKKKAADEKKTSGKKKSSDK